MEDSFTIFGTVESSFENMIHKKGLPVFFITRKTATISF